VTLPPEVNSRIYFNRASECWGLIVDIEGLLEAGDAALERQVFEDCEPIIRDPAMVARFKACIELILSQTAVNPNLVENEGYRQWVNEQVTQILMELIRGRGAENGDLPPPSTRTFIVDKAIQYMENNLANPVGLGDICDAIRICPRTLRYSFEEVIGVSPSRYLLSTRLSGVHRELLQSRSRRLIHCIAHRYGFTHMGRFAKCYKQVFGELPSETCGRLSGSVH
jgi:AraC family transcriptional regulator, ethanolamine operon transcriptional activator